MPNTEYEAFFCYNYNNMKRDAEGDERVRVVAVGGDANEGRDT